MLLWTQLQFIKAQSGYTGSGGCTKVMIFLHAAILIPMMLFINLYRFHWNNTLLLQTYFHTYAVSYFTLLTAIHMLYLILHS